MHHSGRLRLRRLTLSGSTHYNPRRLLSLPKASPEGQERSPLHQWRVPRLVQVVHGHQWVKIGSWIARSVTEQVSTRLIDVPNYRKVMVSLTILKLQDDGSPLLCCGKCSKWQHIVCHDLADRQAGRPKRNWDTEEFICRACQVRTLANGKQVLNGSSYDSGRTPSPYHRQPVGYAGQAPYGQNYTPHPHHAQSPYPQHTAITFSHYQPQHCGFSNTLSSPHAQATSQGPSPYPQTHYTTHSSPSKLPQYSTPQASVISMYFVR